MRLWQLQQDGSLLVRAGKAGVKYRDAGNFGDQADVDAGTDNGVSFKGFKYLDAPGLIGLALPVQYGGDLHPYLNRFVPYVGDNWEEATKVRCYSPETNIDATGVFVDAGPADDLSRAVDLLAGFVAALGLTMREGTYPIDARILGDWR